MRATLIVIGSIAVLAIVVVGGYWLRWGAAPWVGKLEKRQEVQSGAYRKQAYEHFYNLCASVKRKQESLAAQKALAENATGKQKQRVQTRIAALKAQIQGDVEQYNADARKRKTKAQFLGEDLPRRISAQGGRVSCR